MIITFEKLALFISIQNSPLSCLIRDKAINMDQFIVLTNIKQHILQGKSYIKTVYKLIFYIQQISLSFLLSYLLSKIINQWRYKYYSVHTVKVEQIMVKDVIYITKSTTYRELREILRFAPTLKSFPVVTDRSKLSSVEFF